MRNFVKSTRAEKWTRTLLVLITLFPHHFFIFDYRFVLRKNWLLKHILQFTRIRIIISSNCVKGQVEQTSLKTDISSLSSIIIAFENYYYFTWRPDQINQFTWERRSVFKVEERAFSCRRNLGTFDKLMLILPRKLGHECSRSFEKLCRLTS